MDTIQIKDKLFTVSIKEQDIQKEVIRVANEINRDLAGKNPLFLSVLNGSFMFTADLLKHITIPCEISFVKLASYQGITSTGVIKEVIGLNEDIAGRTVHIEVITNLIECFKLVVTKQEVDGAYEHRNIIHWVPEIRRLYILLLCW